MVSDCHRGRGFPHIVKIMIPFFFSRFWFCQCEEHCYTKKPQLKSIFLFWNMWSLSLYPNLFNLLIFVFYLKNTIPLLNFKETNVS